MTDKSDSQITEFWSLMRSLTIWYRLRRSIDQASKGMLLGIAAVLGFSLVAVFTGLGIRLGLGKLELIKLLLLGATLGSVSFGIIMFFWPKPALRIARFFDHHFNLNDRISTSVELISSKSLNLGDSFRLKINQIDDAITHGKAVRPPPSFFFTFSRFRIFTGLVLILLILITIYTGKPYFNQVSQRQLVQQSINSEIIKLEQSEEEIRSNANLSQQAKTELDQILDQTIQKLQQSETPEQAVAVLTQAEADLTNLENTELKDQIQSLEQLGNQLQNDQTGEEMLQDLAKNLSKGDLPAASQNLQDLNLDTLTTEETNSLAEKLSAAADSLAESNPEFANNLQQAADALLNGDSQTAEQAISQAAGMLDQLGNQKAQNDAIQQAAAQTAKSSDQIIQSGLSQQNQSTGDQANQIPGSQSGSSEQTQSGMGQNQGNESGSGDQTGSNNNSGSGKGSTNQGNSTGSEAGVKPIDQSNGPGDGGEMSFEPLVKTQRLGGNGSTDVYLPDTGAEGEQVLGFENSSPGEPGNTNVPYVRVYPAYADAYRQAVEAGSIPLSLRDLVRDYFSHLEP